MLATALYETLEAAMGVQGLARSASTPPLRHAEMLDAMGHPLGVEIVELTEVYLSARFGGASLSEEARRDFETRVRRIRSARPALRAAS